MAAVDAPRKTQADAVVSTPWEEFQRTMAGPENSWDGRHGKAHVWFPFEFG